MYIFPYKGGSRSVRALCQATGAKAIKLEGSRFKGSNRKVVLNWGSSRLSEEALKCRVINSPDQVARASCKLTALTQMSERGVSVPAFTSCIADARRMAEEGVVVIRRTLKGSGGAGIVIAEKPEDIIAAPLYTQYIKKESEYRVHVFNGEVILVQRKARNLEVPDDQVDWRIRNHDRGFIFQRNDVNPSVHVISEASKAIAALDLDFGAVDVIYNRHRDKAYVLEVNCAPGLEGGTIDDYVVAIRKML